MRITTKKLTELCNKILERVELGLRVHSIESTRFTSYQYESGACKQYIRLTNDDLLYPVTTYCYYSKKELEYYLNNGYKLYLKTDKCGGAWEFDVQKVN